MVGGGIFAAVNFVGFKLHKEIKGNKLISLVGFLSCSIALLILIVVLWQISWTILDIFVSVAPAATCWRKYFCGRSFDKELFYSTLSKLRPKKKITTASRRRRDAGVILKI